jgi:hypothetical protein
MSEFTVLATPGRVSVTVVEKNKDGFAEDFVKAAKEAATSQGHTVLSILKLDPHPAPVGNESCLAMIQNPSLITGWSRSVVFSAAG